MSTMLPIYIERGQNAELWDADGRRYVDFAGGIAVVNTGHLHPQVKAAVHQAARCVHAYLRDDHAVSRCG